MFSERRKKYYVLVQWNKPLTFPPLCPFTGESMPSAWVTLKQIGNVRYSFAGMLLGYVGNTYKSVRLKVKASEDFAKLYRTVRAMIWISLLAGIGVTVILVELNDKSPNPSAIPFLGILGALVGAAAFKVYGSFLIKKCYIAKITDEHIEICFASEDYARSLCELNQLEFEARP